MKLALGLVLAALSCESPAPPSPPAPAPAADPTPAPPREPPPAAAPATVEEDPCVRAFEEIELVMTRAADVPGNRIEPRVPDRAGFMEACRSLPVEARRCAVFSHVTRHRRQCEEVAAALDPETRARAERLLREALAGS